MTAMKMSRRLLLQGFGGLGIALPALEFTHGTAWGAAATGAGAAKRFLVFFEHGGTISNRNSNGWIFGKDDDSPGNNHVDAWTPTSKSGDPLTFGAIHQPLVGFEDQCLILGGIDNLANKTQGPYDGDHVWANITSLTNAKVDVDGSGTPTSVGGASIDAVIAARLGKSNPVPFNSVNLYINAHNYGTPFYSAPNQAVDGEGNPSTAFKKLFANVSGGTPDAALVRAQALKRSVLDGTQDGLALFRKKVSSQDYAAIDAHLTLIRGIEQQLQPITVACTKPGVAGTYTTIPQIGPVHADILSAAMACGLTNVGTLNIGDFYNDWMNDPYPAAYNIGHSLDHSANDVGPGGTDTPHFNDWYKTILDNRQWRAGVFARLLKNLKAIPEGNGTMLDNSLLLWTSEFSYGGVHSVANLPVLLAGKAGGALKTGRYLDFAGRDSQFGLYQTAATTGNVYTSLLNLCGFPDTSFGQSWPDYSVYNYGHPYIGTKNVLGPTAGLT